MRSAPRRGGSPKAAFPAPLRDGEMLAALDLGSNSFHMVVAQMVLGQLRVVDRLRESVRMAEGLDGFGGLAPEVRDRALACLSRFGQRVADIPPHRIRAVATNTVRALRAPEAFLVPAETTSGTSVHLVSATDAGVTVVALDTTGRGSVGELELAGVEVAADRVVGGADLVSWITTQQGLGLAAYQLGVLNRVLELSAEYARTREQFDRPIGSFQAVSARLADDYIDIKGLGLTLVQASWRLSEDLPADV